MNDGPTHLSSAAALPNEGKRARRRARSRTSLFAQGEPMIWLTGGGLAIAVCMIVGLLGLIAAQGLSTFWPGALREVRAADGRVLLGEVTRRESIRATHDSEERRRMFRTGNFELTGEHFVWVRDSDVVSERLPEWAMLIERASWGRFYGNLAGFQGPGEDHGESPAEAWAAFQRTMPEVARRRARQNRLEVRDLGEINRNIENARLDVRRAEMKFGADSAEHRSARERQQSLQDAAKVDYERIRAEIRELNECNGQYALRLVTADGTEKILPLAEIVRAVPANQLNRWGRVRVYISRWLEFLRDDPREANSEGGVFPAIFGTVVMTLVMSLAVSPFGVMAALYLREYAGGGPFVSAVRISINNLAGVPSIVFGVFGLGFFCYFAGAGLDSLFFAEKLPTPTFGKGGVLWAALTLALMTLPVVIVATEEALAAVPNSMREGSYACGASKWQTIRRIVLPRALPGIMTGMILAMARGAGEVAPLMLVGAVKLAPELPVDWVAPFLHPERSFMHLGFHIYDLGFQSQNSEAAKPMVYTTTLLLIVVIFVLNILAVRLRTRLRSKFVTAAF